MKFRRGFCFVWVLILVSALAGKLLAQAEGEEEEVSFGNDYLEGEPGVKLFDSRKLTLGPLASRILLEALVAAAVNTNSSYTERRSKSIAIALQIDPQHSLAVGANALFLEKRTPDSIKGFRTLTEIAEVLWLATKRLQTGSEADRTLAKYLTDVAWLCKPKDADFVSLLQEAREDGFVGDWSTIFLPPGPTMDEIEREKLVKAVFASTSGEANALILTRVGDRYYGKSIPVKVESERNEPFKRESRVDIDIRAIDRSNLDYWTPIPLLIQKRAGEKWRTGYIISATLTGEFAGKDIGGSSVATALALEMLPEGKSYDPDFAVSGVLIKDGQIGRVGAIIEKIKGAAKSGCTHVALPKENVIELMDHVVSEGFSDLLKVQVFAVEEFDEVKALALTGEHRDFLVNESLKIYAETAAKIARFEDPKDLSRFPALVERLRKVVELTPNHWSARILLAEASGKGPKVLSIGRSFLILQALSEKVEDSLQLSDELMTELSEVTLDRTRFHPALQPLIQALRTIQEAETERRRISSARLDGKTWQQLRSEGDALVENTLDEINSRVELKVGLDRLRIEPLDIHGAEQR